MTKSKIADRNLDTVLSLTRAGCIQRLRHGIDIVNFPAAREVPAGNHYPVRNLKIKVIISYSDLHRNHHEKCFVNSLVSSDACGVGSCGRLDISPELSETV
jgi:hypothetical protein